MWRALLRRSTFMFPKCIEAFSGAPFDSTRIMSFERIYSLSQSPDLAPIEELFDQQDHLNPETPQDLWFQYWDSYDERLKKGGIRLWTLEEADQTPRVFFQDTSGTQHNIKCPKTPFRVEDIPSQAFQKKILPLVEPRPLLPQLRIHRKRKTWICRNSEGKKILSVLMDEDLELFRPSRFPGDVVIKKRTGYPHLRLHGVRGHGKDFEGLKELIEIRIGLMPLETDIFTLSTQMLGLGEVEKKRKHPLQLHSRLYAPLAVGRVLSIEFQAMKQNLLGTLWGEDIEFLHDFRVSCRRSRSILAQLKSVFPKKTIQPFLDDFAWLSRLTSPVRDLDMLLQKMQKPNTLNHFYTEVLDPILQWIKGRRDEEQTLLKDHLQSERFQVFTQSWEAFLDGQVPPLDSGEDLPSIEPLVSKRIHRLWQRALEEGRRIPDEEAHLAFHELRKTCKKLRYLLEAFRPLYSRNDIQAPVKSLKRFQDLLGLMNDTFVQKEFMQQLSLTEELPEGSRLMAEKFARNYDFQLAESATRFQEVFAEFNDPARHSEWKHLLEQNPLVPEKPQFA